MYFYLPLLACSSCSPTVISAECYQGRHLPLCRILPAVLWMVGWAVAGQELCPPGKPGPEHKHIALQFPWATSQAALNLNLAAAPTDLVAFLDFSYYRNICIICISVCLFLFQIFWGNWIMVYVYLGIWKQSQRGRIWDTQFYNHNHR